MAFESTAEVLVGAPRSAGGTHDHPEGIRGANAASEGFNSVITALKANARGLRNFDNYRTRILILCGKLDRKPNF